MFCPKKECTKSFKNMLTIYSISVNFLNIMLSFKAYHAKSSRNIQKSCHKYKSSHFLLIFIIHKCYNSFKISHGKNKEAEIISASKLSCCGGLYFFRFLFFDLLFVAVSGRKNKLHCNGNEYKHYTENGKSKVITAEHVIAHIAEG